MKRPRNLTPLEWEIMNTVWTFDEFPVTVRQVLERAYPNGEKAYTTVQTIMNHLTEKRFLTRQKYGPVNVYRPNVSAGELQKSETRHFVEKVFGGSFFKLANFLVSSGNLSEEEIRTLKKMLEQNEKEAQND